VACVARVRGQVLDDPALLARSIRDGETIQLRGEGIALLETLSLTLDRVRSFPPELEPSMLETWKPDVPLELEYLSGAVVRSVGAGRATRYTRPPTARSALSASCFTRTGQNQSVDSFGSRRRQRLPAS